MTTFDPFRTQYRLKFGMAITMMVRERQTLETALAALGLPQRDEPRFRQLLLQELEALTVFNYARFRVSLNETQAWIDAGRPQ